MESRFDLRMLVFFMNWIQSSSSHIHGSFTRPDWTGPEHAALETITLQQTCVLNPSSWHPSGSDGGLVNQSQRHGGILQFCSRGAERSSAESSRHRQWTGQVPGGDDNTGKWTFERTLWVRGSFFLNNTSVWNDFWLFASILSDRKTMSHDWNGVHKEGKTLFQLPKECITGHVEGWTFSSSDWTAVDCVSGSDPVLSACPCRSDPEDVDPHESS